MGKIVVRVSGEDRALRSKRVRAIISFLVENEEQIGDIPRGKLTLSFAGEGGLSAVIEEKVDL